MNDDEKHGVGTRIRHDRFGDGVVTGVTKSTFIVNFVDHGRLEIARKYSGLEIIESVTPDEEMIHVSEVEKSLERILRRWMDVSESVELGNKWIGGKLLLQPSDEGIQPKEIPIETFFHKIIMMRDRLRVLEQNINSHAVLSDEEKIHLQQYITRIYGSLTTFNILFKHKEDYFVGEKS
ncbi:hypothetical protein KDK77_08980 [bacterium]|nr:hypothetical protein [bacterium]MCP5462779.1 hypothetical protein [bacterium]